MAARVWLAAVLGFCSVAGCSSKDNLLGLTVPVDHRQEFENQLDLAQAAYDRGDATAARKYASNALNLDPGSERASILFGFISLALAGGDPYALARALIGATGSKDAASTLTALKSTIGLQPDELLQLGTLDTAVAGLPVIIPACAEAVRPVVARLSALNDAIDTICPFVDPAILNIEDLRQHCGQTTLHRKQPDQAHFLWAFSHLAEALAFNQVLTYSTVDPNTPNLQLRVAQLNSESKANPDPVTFIAAVNSISNTLQAILPISGICSAAAPTTQFNATLHDLQAVTAGFSRLSGAPPSVRSTLDTALGTITSAQQKSAGSSASIAALKGQFSKGVAASVAASIASQVANLKQPLTTDQKTQLCAAFSNIAAGSGQTSALCGSAN